MFGKADLFQAELQESSLKFGWRNPHSQNAASANDVQTKSLRFRDGFLRVSAGIEPKFIAPFGGDVRQRFQQNARLDRKSTRLNSSHTVISYAVFCLKKKNSTTEMPPQSRRHIITVERPNST